MPAHYDVIIIGSGAGGATLAQALAPTGKSILILERGEHVPVEQDNWSPKAVFIDKKYRTREQWLDKDGQPFVPNTHYWVGGNTTFYGAALMRMKALDFEEVAHAGGGISPAWPLRYGDMAPWYAQAEKLWEVHGTRGIDPNDQPDDPPLPFPALTHDPGIAALKTHFESKGWHPSPLPLGVRRDDAKPDTSKCIRCETCGGYPCLLKAKVDARTAALDPIASADNVTLLTGRKAVRLETNANGNVVTGVFTEGHHGSEYFTGDLVVCSAGAVNSSALLLASSSAAHPDGLANGSGQVGRNYMFHATSAVISVSLAPFESTFPKTLCVNDFYFGEPDGSFDYPMGQIQLLEFMSGQTLEGQVADYIPPALIPDQIATAAANRMVAFLAMSEDLPEPDNRVTLTPDGAIQLSYTFGDLTAHTRLVRKLEHALADFFPHNHTLMEHRFQIDELLPLYGTAHQCGTVRFGTDPKTSVLDIWCKAHEVDNLYVVDASFFVSASAVNPTLTIVANALRVAEHLRGRLG